jgi:bifunctional non-homologous end joining protein LigD
VGLREYRRKRSPARTPEPFGGAPGGARRFSFQRHHARRLHWDLRLESGGVLASWAIPRGPPPEPGERRLAIKTEDHPLDYIHWEGVIPKGEYGAGTVELWDAGDYELRAGAPELDEQIARGRVTVTLRGRRVAGTYHLVRTSSRSGGKEQWLIFMANELPSQPPASRGEETGVASTILRQAHLARAPRAPLPRRLAPMLPSRVERAPDGEWLVEVKHDGARALAWKRGDDVRLVSRGERSLTERFPEVVRAIARVPVDEALLDLEVCALDERGVSRFQLLQRPLAGARARAVADEAAIVAYAFDLLHLDGRDLRAEPIEKRKAALAALLRARGKDPVLRYSDHVVGRAGEVLARAVALGAEGIVAKQPGSGYASGRTRAWVKVKRVESGSFVIGGFTPPGGSRRGLGALLVGQFDQGALRFAGKVGSGMATARLLDLTTRLEALEVERSPFERGPPVGERRARWVRPELVCEVLFSEVTRDGKLRAPVFQGLRPDLRARDCIWEAPAPLAPERKVEITHRDKVLWPASRTTKGEYLDWLERAGDLIVPHLRDRPLTLVRFPDGIDREGFYQKTAPASRPGWVRTADVVMESRTMKMIVCDDRDTLRWLGQSAAIEISPWPSRTASLDRPDYVMIDLDPVESAPFSTVILVARAVKDVLDDMGLRGYPKTSGGDGMHVFVPVDPVYTWEQARELAHLVGRLVLDRVPRRAATLERVIPRRHGVYLDWLQNVRGKHVVGAYTARAREPATVSMPLAWDEVRRGLDPKRFTVRTAPKRLDELRDRDLFAPTLAGGQRIEDALARVGEMLKEPSARRSRSA